MHFPTTSAIFYLAATLATYILPVCTIHAADPTVTDSIVSIEQTLNLFASSVDTHDYALLDSVFSPDATANFGTSAGPLVGLPAIKSDLQSALTGTVSQHALSTHMIDVAGNPTGLASASTYLQGTFFGQGNLTGQILHSYGRYDDLLRLSSVGWRVYNRTLVVIGTEGNVQIA